MTSTSTSKTIISFLLSFLSFLLCYCYASPFFFLPFISQSLTYLAGTIFSFSFSNRLQWVPGYSFLLGNDTTDKLTRRGALLQPFAVSFSFSPLASRIHSSFLSDWRRSVSSKFATYRVDQYSLSNLSFLVTLVVSSLVFGATKHFLHATPVNHRTQDAFYFILYSPAMNSVALFLSWRLFFSLQSLV